MAGDRRNAPLLPAPDDLQRFRQRVFGTAKSVFRWKLWRGRAVIDADDPLAPTRFSIEPLSRKAAPVRVSVDSTSQISLFTGTHSLPLILVGRDSGELSSLFKRHLTEICRGRYRESVAANGVATTAVAEIGRGLECAFVGYNTVMTRISQTPRDWARIRYRAY